MNQKRINLLSIFAFVLFVALIVTILLIPSNVAFADEENCITYNENKYYYEDSSYIDADEHDMYTLCRTFNISSYTDDAKVNSGLYMPKGRYCTMYVSQGLYKEILESTFSIVDETIYQQSQGYNFYITKEQYNVSGFEFLKQNTYNDFNIATSDDIEGRYKAGDAFHDNYDGTIYKVEEYTESYIQSYILNDLSNSYYVDSTLILSAYFENKSNESDIIQVCLKINFASVELKPVQDGDIFKAIGEYSYTSNLEHDSYYYEYGYSYVEFAVNSEAFDVSKGGYDIEIDGYTRLPINSKLQYIVDGNVVVDTQDSYIMINEFPEELYTIQGLLTFETNTGEKVTLKSNILTIKKYVFDVRTNNIYSTNVKVNEPYSYTLSIDRGKTSIKNFENSITYWTFDYTMGDDSSMSSVEGDSASFAYTNEGKKYLLVDFNGSINSYEQIHFIGKFEQEVSENPTREIPTYLINFNVEDGSTLVVGGEIVKINATINEVYGDEAFDLKLYMSAGSFADNLSTDDSSLIINPLSSGKIVIMCKATSDIVGAVEKSISLNIVNPKSDKIELVTDDSFHKVGEDLIVKLSIGGVTKFINYTPTWQVQKENGESYENITFATNDGNAVVSAAAKGYYKFSINDSVLTVEENTFRVSKVNMAEVAAKALPFLAVIMVIAVIIYIIIKKKILVGKTVENQLKKIDALLTRRLAEKEYDKKHLTRDLSSMLLRVNNALNIAEELDQKSLGQHQPLIESLTTIKKILIASTLKKDSMSEETIRTLFTKLKETYIEPSIQMSADINDVMEKFRGERAKNIMVVDPNANEDEDEEKEDI